MLHPLLAHSPSPRPLPPRPADARSQHRHGMCWAQRFRVAVLHSSRGHIAPRQFPSMPDQAAVAPHVDRVVAAGQGRGPGQLANEVHVGGHGPTTASQRQCGCKGRFARGTVEYQCEGRFARDCMETRGDQKKASQGTLGSRITRACSSQVPPQAGWLVRKRQASLSRVYIQLRLKLGSSKRQSLRGAMSHANASTPAHLGSLGQRMPRIEPSISAPCLLHLSYSTPHTSPSIPGGCPASLYAASSP